MSRNIVIQHGMVALLTALLSVLSKEWIYQYTIRIGRRLRSNMVIANAWHSRTDAISSVIVIAGVGGAMAGFSYLDGVAAIAVALLIAKIGWDLLWKSLQELIDTALEPEMVEEIRHAILAVDGVRACHMLRTRYSGSDSLVDVHILVDPALSVSEGHQIGERVRKELIEQVEHVADVTVHIDPEDDESTSLSEQLPMREVIEARLHREWQQDGLDGDVERVVLHYLEGKVHVEVFLRAQLEGDPAARAAALQQAARRARDIGEVQVYASAIDAP
jgi:divalent metal cation (Fe/Co/Zn/Cd) transporter